MIKYSLNKEIFLDQNNLSFYLLGAYMTDGNVYSKTKYNYVSISSKDGDWIEFIRDIISPTRPIYKKKNQELYTLKFNSKEIVNWLTEFGCIPNKSKCLKIQKSIPDIFIKDFILGVFDGDGSISISKYKKVKNNKTYYYNKINAYICSGSEIFINQINKMIPSEINRCIVTLQNKSIVLNGRKLKDGKIWRIHFNDSNAIKFLNWIYSSNVEIFLPRKSKIYKNIISNS